MLELYGLVVQIVIFSKAFTKYQKYIYVYIKVYAILAQGELLPNYFTTYKKVLDEVKKVYPG